MEVVKRKQTPKKNTNAPVYNEKIVLPRAGNEVVVELWDNDSETKNDMIGSLSLDYSQYQNKKVKQWFKITPTESGEKDAGEVELEIGSGEDTTPEDSLLAAVSSRSFHSPPQDVVVSSRSFNIPPQDGSGSTSLSVAVHPNTDATGNVDIYGTLPLTLANRLALTSPCHPYSFVLKEVLSGGTYRIQLISQLYAPAWGRWAGLVKQENINLKEYHIVGNNALDHDTVQISTLGVKSGGKWLYRKADYVEPAGRVDLVLEYQTSAGTLLASWNGQTLPYDVTGIPQGQHFTFELPNSLELTIVGLVKVPSPTLKPVAGHTHYKY